MCQLSTKKIQKCELNKKLINFFLTNNNLDEVNFNQIGTKSVSIKYKKKSKMRSLLTNNN